MINSGIEITYKKEGSSLVLDQLYSFTPSGGRDILNKNSVYLSFPFFNLVQNTPYRVIIYNETFPSSGEKDYYKREMANTWITLARLYNTLRDSGVSIPDRISYTPYYINKVFYIQQGVSFSDCYLFFTEYDDGNGNVKTSTNGADYLIFYPLIFKKTSIGYYSIYPVDGPSIWYPSETEINPYNEEDMRSYIIPANPSYQGIPVFELSKGGAVPNIIPSKFNLDMF